MLSKETSRIEDDTTEAEETLASIREELNVLKVELYARFGKQINLET